MKRKVFYPIMIICSLLAFASCSKDNEGGDEEKQKHDPTSDEDQIEIVAYDGLEWLQNSLVVIDEEGNFVRRTNGTPLDMSDTTVVSVYVTDIEAAKEIFLSWVAPGKTATPDGDGYTYSVTDKEGVEQGSAEFKPADGTESVIARMTISEDTDIKYVSEVLFRTTWPDNAGIGEYEKGKTYMIHAPYLYGRYHLGYFDPDVLDLVYMEPRWKELEFYCIQGNNNGKEAILVWLCPDSNDEFLHPRLYSYVEENGHIHLPTLPEAKKVLDYHNNNYKEWSSMVSKMGWKPKLGFDTTGNAEFALNSYNSKTEKIKCLDLDDKKGKICDVSIWSIFTYRYMLVRIYPPRP